MKDIKSSQKQKRARTVRMRSLLAVLLTFTIMLTGCGKKAADNVPEDLQPFEEDLEGQTRDQIREYFWNMIYKTINTDTEPYLLSRITVAKAQIPQFKESGEIEGFKSAPYYQDSLRVVIPSGERSVDCSSLEWNTVGDRHVIAWKGSTDSITKSIWEPGDSRPYVREITNTSLGKGEAARTMQLRWLADMFSTGLYQPARWGKLLDFGVNPLIFPANGQMFKYTVEKEEPREDQEQKNKEDESAEHAEDLISAQQQHQEGQNRKDESSNPEQSEEEGSNSDQEAEDRPENQDDYVLKISIRDPNTFAQSLKGARLGFLNSAGYQLSNINVPFDDFTFSRYEFEVLLSSEGVIKRVTENIDVRFITYVGEKNKSVSANESSTTVWTIDPYPQAPEKYQGIIDQMVEGEKPEGLEQLIRE